VTMLCCGRNRKGIHFPAAADDVQLLANNASAAVIDTTTTLQLTLGPDPEPELPGTAGIRSQTAGGGGRAAAAFETAAWEARRERRPQALSRHVSAKTTAPMQQKSPHVRQQNGRCHGGSSFRVQKPLRSVLPSRHPWLTAQTRSAGSRSAGPPDHTRTRGRAAWRSAQRLPAGSAPRPTRIKMMRCACNGRRGSRKHCKLLGACCIFPGACLTSGP